MSSTFDRIIGQARRASGMTRAEFDYSLAVDDGAAGRHISEFIYYAACGETDEQRSTMTDRERRAADRALHEQLKPELDALIAETRAQSYTGWSKAFPGQIRYAR